ncbi:MAG TPA: TIGR03435 family protein [Bryobacteraceae bacterium]|nr:TIGR03435 family protein [Bryobacteraceae bacterium]
MNKYRCAVLILFLISGVRAQELKEFTIEAVESMGSHHNSLSYESVAADRIPLRELIGFVYGTPPMRVFGPDWLGDTYSVTAKPRAGEEEKFLPTLQRVLAERLHLRVEHASREMPVYVLRAADPASPKLHSNSGASSMRGQEGSVAVENASMSDVANLLTRTFGKPVVDETGLTGSYSFKLEWQAGDRESLIKVMREQLGLTVAEDRRKVDVLQVDRK